MIQRSVATAGWILMASSLCLAASTANTKIIRSREGNCQMAVPATWSFDAAQKTAESRDKRLAAIISSPKNVSSFAALKQTAKGLYTKSTVTKDSGSEFEMEGQSYMGSPDVFRAIPIAGNKFCMVDVTYKSGPADTARQIARTLKAGM
jgi:hypothetical protein